MFKQIFFTTLGLAAICTSAPAQSVTDERGSGVSPAEIHGQKSRLDAIERRKSLSGPTIAHLALAARAAVSTDDYSHSEIVRMMAAKSTGKASVIEVEMNKLHGKRPMAAGHVSPGEQALASQLGVDARDYTLTELSRMKFAKDF